MKTPNVKSLVRWVNSKGKPCEQECPNKSITTKFVKDIKSLGGTQVTVQEVR
jgi:hypothetical protein